MVHMEGLDVFRLMPASIRLLSGENRETPLKPFETGGYGRFEQLL